MDKTEDSFQTVTITFFHFSTWYKRLWAFTQMGKRPFSLQTARGLSFVKLMGVGKGFMFKPDFTQYSLFAIWENEAQAQDFFKNNALFHDFKDKTSTYLTLFLRPTMAHGKWDGNEPFSIKEKFEPQKPVAVLTRATVRPRKMLDFWRNVPAASRAIGQTKNVIFSKGIGELPVIQQATFSVWVSGESMMQYAYTHAGHAEIVKKTRDRGWYSEEMFARFKVLRVEGNAEEIGKIEPLL
jgi:heme-degrading monooxygenase HmoA